MKYAVYDDLTTTTTATGSKPLCTGIDEIILFYDPQNLNNPTDLGKLYTTNQAGNNPKNKAYALVSLTGIAVILILASITRLWVLTAVPIGFLFGFFLQKGDLCGSSAFSEVIMMKDRRKVFGLWIIIVVGMAGIAVLDVLGWITLNPKPFIYLNYIYIE